MATPTQNSVPFQEIPLPGNQLTAAELSGYKWGSGGIRTGADLTYSFPSGSVTYISNYGSDGDASEWKAGGTALNSIQQARFADALDEYAGLGRLTFTQVADNSSTVGEIRATFTAEIDGAQTGGFGYYPGPDPAAGDVWFPSFIPSGFSNFSDVSDGSWGFQTFLHEIGHALGLKHPFEDFPLLPSQFDNMFYTVMSYTQDPFGNDYDMDRFPSTPMLLDVQAIQYMYGANFAHNAGNTTYTYYEGGKYLETIWDGNGFDTIQYVGNSGGTIDLRPGHFSKLGDPVSFTDSFGNFKYSTSSTVAVAYSTQIENAIGSAGSDILWGNAANNWLYGNAGNDFVVGLNGIDRLFGGPGNDKLLGGNGTDILVGGPGNDRMEGGPGADALNGGTGSDKFIFNSVLSNAEADRVYFFASGEDKLKIDDDVFTNLATFAGNPLSANEFAANATGQALDADDRILYNTSTGELFYDVDGNGAGAAQLFATLVDAPALVATDILVIA